MVTVDGLEDVPGGNETALMQAVTVHPVAVGLCVGPWIKEWRAYTGGILRVPGKTRAFLIGTIVTLMLVAMRSVGTGICPKDAVEIIWHLTRYQVP